MNSSKSLYKTIFEEGKKIPLYGAPWWLDVVCGKEGWDVMDLQEDQEGPSVLVPVYRTRIRGLRSAITPPMTQWVPVLSTEKNPIFTPHALSSALTSSEIVDITLKSSGAAAFSESSFQIRYKYSYIIPFDPERKNVRAGYNEGLRRNLKAAEIAYEIDISDRADILLELCHATYHQQKIKAPWWLDQLLPEIYKALDEQQAGQMLIAKDQGKPVAAILTGRDQDTIYYLTGGRVADLRGASAHALLLDRAIQGATNEGCHFDFEGSMHSGIANFFQSFGAVPEPYLNIRRFRGIGRLWSYFQ